MKIIIAGIKILLILTWPAIILLIAHVTLGLVVLINIIYIIVVVIILLLFLAYGPVNIDDE